MPPAQNPLRLSNNPISMHNQSTLKLFPTSPQQATLSLLYIPVQLETFQVEDSQLSDENWPFIHLTDKRTYIKPNQS